MNNIHQEVEFKQKAEKLYEVLLDAKQFSAATGGAPTEIGKKEGDGFSCFGGFVTGRNIELVSGKRIVQAWRAKNWEEGRYSLVRFELIPQSGGTKLVLDHDAFPNDQKDHLAAGWHANYWDNLKKV